MERQKKHSKSQRQLHRALLELLRAEPFPEITVTALTAYADLSRAVFYLYYRDKEALLDEIISDLADGLTGLMLGAYRDGLEAFYDEIVEGTPRAFVDYFRYFRAHSETIHILAQEGNGTDFYTRFDMKMTAYKEGRVARWSTLNETDDKRPTKNMLYDAGIKNLTDSLFRWVQCGMEPDEEQMARHHARMWVSYLLLLKGTEDDISYRTITKVLAKHGTTPEQYR